MRTTVIEIAGGPGVGKSTFAAELYCAMKKKNYAVELIGETIKKYCIMGHERTPWLKLQALVEQIKAEIELYGHIDYIITDSPLFLYCVYENVFEKTSMMKEIYDKIVRSLDVNRLTFLKMPINGYDSFGRWESQEEAQTIQNAIIDFMPNIKCVSKISDITTEPITTDSRPSIKIDSNGGVSVDPKQLMKSASVKATIFALKTIAP